MTFEEATNIIRRKNPEMKIISCKDYGDDYLITAYKTEDDYDPFYLVNKSTGKIEPYTIAEDPNKYYSAKELLED